jgi:L-alanine-DL-glutamate epimerase-like enolase superfamily enzyme
MIGCNYESNISITTGAQLALSLPVDFVDLDSGIFDFDEPDLTGGAVIQRGHISVPLMIKFSKSIAQ